MTDKQRQLIKDLREINMGYAEIASITRQSRDSVKQYCRLHGLGGIRKGLPEDNTKCRNCGKPITSTPGKKRKIFCSDYCRQYWNNRHRNFDHYKKFHIQVCANCGKEFKVFSTSVRKYCSHPCYITKRFGPIDNC